ncbi:hypothetical protein Psch_02181 [Pelotomaculum schinkii]|uniref:Uncharacterized protein n=1 Tax=Pelotomaculum schinkii TaxID=78350 RepID=A0A4Y7RHY8_9FIRM|nr:MULTISPECIES: hypothetical protein [Pelotomaculum]TEB08615.1 hypothetical protein Psch_02181 [Pelotomaculum schinkii]TEB16810.1 hypothetical protein Psfp_00972 [Pelotomaculum sp. FP]
MLNPICKQIIDNRCDEIGQAVANKPEFSSVFDECCHLYDILRYGTSPELIEHLEGLHSTLISIVEQEFYLAGLQDGTSLKQFFTGEGMLDVAS